MGARKLFAVVVCGMLWFLMGQRVHAAAEQAPLDVETMKVALRTDTPEEDGFLEAVVGLVNKGQLSRSLVESTFQWARKKDRLRFQYFKYALLKRLSERRG